MFKDHLDFEFKPWNLEDSEHGKKEIYFETKNNEKCINSRTFMRSSVAPLLNNLTQTIGTMGPSLLIY